MSRSRILYALLAVALTAGVTMVVADTDEVDMQALADKIDALDKRIQNLERTLATRLTQLERSIAKGGGAGPTPQHESEAQQAYASVNKHVTAGNFEQAKTEMAAFMTKYGDTNTAKQARRLNTELSVIGKQVPEKWGIENWFQGEKDIDLASDKATLLVFWEVWCPHCKREVPKLQDFYTKLHGDGLQLVGLTKINKSATPEKVTAFIEEHGLKYPVAKEDGTLSTYFNVSGVPAAAVVKGGKVIWRGHPARLTEEMLKGWL